MQNTIENLFFDYQQTEEYAKAEKKMSRKEDVNAAIETFVDIVPEKDLKKVLSLMQSYPVLYPLWKNLVLCKALNMLCV